jgi:hypothetical protein
MDNQETTTNGGSKLFQVLAALLFIAVIGGFSTWFYLNRTPEIAVTEKADTEEIDQDSLEGLLTELDADLDDIDQSLEGNEDDTSNI